MRMEAEGAQAEHGKGLPGPQLSWDFTSGQYGRPAHTRRPAQGPHELGLCAS